MCSFASFDYRRREFRTQALETPSSILLHSMHRRHTATKLFISFYLQLRQGRCVVIKCTRSTATDTIFVHPDKDSVCSTPFSRADLPRQGGGGRQGGEGGQICTGRSSCTGLFLRRTSVLCRKSSCLVGWIPYKRRRQDPAALGSRGLLRNILGWFGPGLSVGASLAHGSE